MLIDAQLWGLGDFTNYGFTLKYLDDHTLALLHEGERIAIFSQTGATEIPVPRVKVYLDAELMGTAEESIQAECAKHLVRKHGWDLTLWQSTS